MILSLSDFLGDNIVVVVLILLGGILGTIGYLKRNVFAKYLPHDDIDQTPEEILQDELDSLLVTEKYNPVEKKTKEQELLDDDDDDFDYDNQQEVVSKKEDEFIMNDLSSYSFSDLDKKDSE